MENSLNRLSSFFTKANYTTQVRGYFVARDDGENDSINYVEPLLNEASERCCPTAEADPLEKGQRLF
jgi:hypothetical protein